jgi:hypothetical protein
MRDWRQVGQHLPIVRGLPSLRRQKRCLHRQDSSLHRALVLRPDALKVALHSCRQIASHTTLAIFSTRRACSMTDLVAFESQRAMDMLLLVLCWNTLYRRRSICQLVEGGNCLGALRIDIKHDCAWQHTRCMHAAAAYGHAQLRNSDECGTIDVAAEMPTGDGTNAAEPKSWHTYVVQQQS